MTRHFTPDAFWRRVGMGPNGCWVWLGFTHKGYGRVSVRGKTKRAHRVSWELTRGQIPDGLSLDHLCRNERCVNPAHLEPVTHAENVRRGRSGVRQLARTHCPAGHPYTGANLTFDSYGYRQCRTCRNAQARSSRLRIRGVA